MMHKTRGVVAVLTIAIVVGLYALTSGQTLEQRQGDQQSTQVGGPPPPREGPMSFFITSVGKGNGANLGGLAGADAYCQAVAAAAGRGSARWRAYLSTQGPDAINARDRIGKGPWYNANGRMVAMSVAQLHGDTIEQARLGNVLGKQTSLTEKRTMVSGFGDTPNIHDILTGSQPDGRAYTDSGDHTCSNWTSNADGIGGAEVGHSDKQGGGQDVRNGSWNSAHRSRGCSQPNFLSGDGAGLLYCFAVN